MCSKLTNFTCKRKKINKQKRVKIGEIEKEVNKVRKENCKT